MDQLCDNQLLTYICVKFCQINNMHILCTFSVSVIMTTAMQLLVRSAILFCVGVFFSLVLNLLQVHRELLEPGQQPGKFDHYESSWWVLPACGMTAGKFCVDGSRLDRCCLSMSGFVLQ